jgi:peptide/nickel transport system permease protein
VERVVERLPATLELVTASLVLATLLTAPLGLASALSRGWPGRVASFLSFSGLALPVFWFGLVLQLIFSLGLGWFPSSGRTTPGFGGLADRLSHLVLPATMLAAVHAAAWSRYLRAAVVDTFAQPYVAAARARGAAPRLVLTQHVLRPALLPVVTIVFLDAALMVAGTVVTESVFAWPGLGSLFTEALARRDYTVLMALLMVASAAVVLANLIADLVYPLIDPRVCS